MSVRVIEGDCRVSLRALPADSVHCCISSPPYFGLRDYGTGMWEGGDTRCDHVVGEMRRGLGLAKAAPRGGGHKLAKAEDIKARSTCPKCGAHWIDRQIGLEEVHDCLGWAPGKAVRGAGKQKPMDASNGREGYPRGANVVKTLRFGPTCGCGEGVKPCTVLDPFGGAGTTALVSSRFGRSALLLELNPDYAEMARQRVRKDYPLFADGVT